MPESNRLALRKSTELGKTLLSKDLGNPDLPTNRSIPLTCFISTKKKKKEKKNQFFRLRAPNSTSLRSRHLFCVGLAYEEFPICLC